MLFGATPDGVAAQSEHLWRTLLSRMEIMLCPLLLSLALAQEPAAPRPERPLLEAALEVALWLDRVAVEVPGGLGWPADPARSRVPGWTLYAGSPGVVLFDLELAEATQDRRWFERAEAGANGLVGWWQASREGAQPGLYTGAAGVAWTLLEADASLGGTPYRETADEILDTLSARATGEGDARSLTPVTDVIAGDAGIGFVLLDTAARFGRPQDLALAQAIGHSLVARGTATKWGTDWPMSPGYERRMPNFSHGTAGVATFLALLAAATEEPAFLAAAVSGAEHVMGVTRAAADGQHVPHHLPGGEELFYLGWCHGPPGTARLFRALHAATGEDKYLAFEAVLASTLHQIGLPQGRTDGYWNNVGPCCGSAGVAQFLVERHVAGPSEVDLALARALTADLLARGLRDEHGLRWEHAEHRARPELLSIQTGWMQGAAGIGHWLLTLDALDNDREARISLPDDRPLLSGRR